MEHDLTVYLMLYDRDSLAVSQKLFASVEEYIDDHYVAQNDESYQFDRRRRESAERRRRLKEDAAPPMLGAVPAPAAAAPVAARSLESLMDNLGESFTTRLLRLIDERGLKDSTVYKQSNISRQHFSKIQCNRDYNPKKKTVLAFAVARGLIDGKGMPESTFESVKHKMRYWGEKYPHAGYGGMFRRWLRAEKPKPYGSFGNGSAMRVSAAGWLFDTLDKTLEMAKVTAEVAHNHPEGIKGAQATAAAIFLARTGHSKLEIKQYAGAAAGRNPDRAEFCGA